MIINNIVNETGFTQINNSTLRDRRLSAAARGILAYLLTHSEKFEVRRETIMAEFNLSRDKTVEFLGELQKFGYLDTSKACHKEDGTWAGKKWTVFGTSQLPDVAGEPKRKRAANTTSFSSENNPHGVTAQPDDGLSGQRLCRATSRTPIFKNNNLKEGAEQNSASASGFEIKNNLTPDAHKVIKTDEKFLDADKTSSRRDSKRTENDTKKNLANKSNSKPNVNSDLNQKEVPASILIYKHLCEGKEPNKTEFEKIVEAVPPGLEQVWKETINEYQIEAFEKGYGNPFYVQAYIDRFKAKMAYQRISSQAQSTKTQNQSDYINQETGLGYA